MSWVFCSNRSNSLRRLPMSLEKSRTASRLRSPEITTCSWLSSIASLPAWTAACISTAISPRSCSTSVFSRSRTSSRVRPA
jgi:hypothetical protein